MADHRRNSNSNNNGQAHHPPPAVGSIQQGQIVRIEAYGAFCQLRQGSNNSLQRHQYRGLIHISQLSSMQRVENVNDVVELDDNVWVRVLEVEHQQQESSGEQHQQHARYKIRLTMKEVPQDGSAPAHFQAEMAAQQASQSLEQNLNSRIGMAVARDPMSSYTGRLVLKQSHEQPKVINGYALLLEDDDEEETDLSPAGKPTASSALVARGVVDSTSTIPAASRAMGRGRGTTLPAWLVAQQRGESTLSLAKSGKRRSDEGSSRSSHDNRDKKKHKKKERNSRHLRGGMSKQHSSRIERDSGRRRRDDSDTNSENSDRRSRTKKRRERSRNSRPNDNRRHPRSAGSGDDSDKASRRRCHRRRNEEYKGSSPHERESDSNQEDSERNKRRRVKGSSDDNDVRFHSVDEARKFIEATELRRRTKQEYTK
jgi:predicted RNA-binding protein with RPS1 domain